MVAIWSFPTRVVFGAGEVARLGDEVAAIGAARSLIVTDLGVEAAGLVRPVVAALEARGIVAAVYTGVDGNPVEANVEGGFAAFEAHRADSIVAVGGGSPMDVAKLVAVRSRTPLPFEELDDSVGGGRHVPTGLPPVITVPTTAGTGSEVGRAGVVTLRSTNRKTVIFSPSMMPRLALLDPALTVSMPPRTTAATGFDALTHCIEAYFAKGDHPMADAIALAGVDLVSKNLGRAVTNPEDLSARGAMMKAAMMGAVAFQKGLGACHSLAHPLSSDAGLHHGLANALCLPAVADFNEPTIVERVLHVGILLGGEPELGACSAKLRELRQAVGLPPGLSAAGVPAALLEQLADKAIDDACHRDNPRPCTRDDLLALYRASL